MIFRFYTVDWKIVRIVKNTSSIPDIYSQLNHLKEMDKSIGRWLRLM